MVTMAIGVTGVAAFLWQRNPTNRARALRAAADAAGWVERRLSAMAERCRRAVEARREAAAANGEERADYERATQVYRTLAATETMRAWYTPYR